MTCECRCAVALPIRRGVGFRTDAPWSRRWSRRAGVGWFSLTRCSVLSRGYWSSIDQVCTADAWTTNKRPTGRKRGRHCRVASTCHAAVRLAKPLWIVELSSSCLEHSPQGTHGSGAIALPRFSAKAAHLVVPEEFAVRLSTPQVTARVAIRRMVSGRDPTRIVDFGRQGNQGAMSAMGETRGRDDGCPSCPWLAQFNLECDCPGGPAPSSWPSTCWSSR